MHQLKILEQAVQNSIRSSEQTPKKLVMRSFPDQWADMSNSLVHFVRGSADDNGYRAMMGILSKGSLIPNLAFGIGRELAPSEALQKSVCFSEIPAGEWGRLQQKRQTPYGIGFTKDFLRQEGANQVWYVEKDSEQWRTLKSMMRAGRNDSASSIWKLTPWIDSPGRYGRSRYFFEWEREWRHLGTLRFSPEDVAFLLIPEDLHEAAHFFFQDAVDENLGPGYFCPYIDPSWSRQRILHALNQSSP
jgi:hypothetical protein